MSNYEMETGQMNSVTSDLFKLYLSLGTARISIKGRAWLLNDGSDASAAIKRRLEKLASKIGDEAVNVNQLYYYNKQVVAETKEAELGAVMDMKGYSESVQKVLRGIYGALGDISDGVDGYIDLIKHAKKIYNDVADATSVKGNWKAEAAYKSGEYAATDGYTYVNGEYKLGYAEADASFWGGIFVKDENGNLKFNPGFAATIGASAIAFTAKGEVGAGDNIFGSGLEGEVTLGKVSAEMGASFGIFDKEGKVNPNLNLDASAEAILAEAKGTARATVLGTDFKITGSANVGAGAHANVNLSAETLTIDIGASVGVGLGLQLEIDFSDTIDTVADVSRGIYNMGESVKKYIKKIL